MASSTEATEAAEAAEATETAETTTTDFSHVIDWTEAMEQCGDDEDFLRELLSDLRGEIDAQIVKIDAVLEKPIKEQSFLSIMRASHVIKGAASNLMCQQLREGATNVEQAAEEANALSSLEDVDSEKLEVAAEKVKQKYADLMKAVGNYHEFLQSVDV